MRDHGRRRSPARLLAPLALVLAAVATVVIIAGSGHSSPPQAPALTTTAGEKTGQRPATRRRTYTVKLNDTLGLISEKTGVSVEQIQTLNPSLDPQNLVVGQKLKLRE
jgi:LysM repeat protein